MACKEVATEAVLGDSRKARQRMAVNNSKRRSLEGGYQCEFVEKPKELQSECSICLSILCEPYTVDCCGNKFCRTCIKRVEDENKPCPLCNIAFTSVRDRQLERQLNERAVYCKNKDKGCNWIGELSQLKKHLNLEASLNSDQNTCDYQGEPCPYKSAGCTFNKPKPEIEAHLKQNVAYHATLAARKTETLDAGIKTLRAELQTTKQRSQTLREELQATKQMSQTMKEELQAMKQISQTMRAELEDSKQTSETMRVELETAKWTSQVNRMSHGVLVILLAILLVFVAVSYYQNKPGHLSDRVEIFDFERDLVELKAKIDLLQPVDKHDTLEDAIQERKQKADFNPKTKTTDTAMVNKLDAVETVIQKLNTSVEQLSEEVTVIDRFTHTVSGNIINLTTRVQKLENIQITSRKLAADSQEQEVSKDKSIPMPPQVPSYLTLPVHLTLASFSEYRRNGSVWHSLPFYTNEGHKLILTVDLNGEDETGHKYTELSLKLLNKENNNDYLSYKANFTVELSYNTTVLGQDLIFPKTETVVLSCLKPSHMEYIRDRSNLIIDQLQLTVSPASVPGNNEWKIVMILKPLLFAAPNLFVVWMVVNLIKDPPPSDVIKTAFAIISIPIGADLLIYYSYIWIGYLVLLVYTLFLAVVFILSFLEEIKKKNQKTKKKGKISRR